jgi:hypothetical protein
MKSKKNQAAKGHGPASTPAADPQVEGSAANAAAAAGEIACLAAAARTPAVAIDYQNVAAYKAYVAVKKGIADGSIPYNPPRPSTPELCFPRWGELPNVTDDAQFWYRRVRAMLAYGVDDFNFAGGKFRVRVPPSLIPSHPIQSHPISPFPRLTPTRTSSHPPTPCATPST